MLKPDSEAGNKVGGITKASVTGSTYTVEFGEGETLRLCAEKTKDEK